MPNHVTNVVEILDLGGVALSEVHAALLNADRQVDFDMIKPSPTCLRDFEPNSGVVSRAKMALGLLDEPSREPKKLSDFTANLALNSAIRDLTSPLESKHIESVARAILNYADCGHVYWHDWNNQNWGTKWNAYGQPDDGYDADATVFQFQTAWSHPDGLISDLSKSLPDVLFAVKYADEDTGCNCGWYEVKSGKRTAQTIAPLHDDQSRDERRKFAKFAFELCNPSDDPSDYGYDANWDYAEEIEA